MNSCYNDKFCPEKWGSSGLPSCPATDGPEEGYGNRTAGWHDFKHLVTFTFWYL